MNDERKTQREKLLSQRKNGYDRVPAQEIPAMERYCSLYKTFLHQNRARVRPGSRGAGGKGGLQAL